MAVAGPALVTGLAALIPHRSAAVAALLYLLANLNYRNNWRLYDSISQTIAPREGVIQTV